MTLANKKFSTIEAFIKKPKQIEEFVYNRTAFCNSGKGQTVHHMDNLGVLANVQLFEKKQNQTVFLPSSLDHDKLQIYQICDVNTMIK